MVDIFSLHLHYLKIGTLKCDGTAESSQAEEYGGKPDNTNRRLQSENQSNQLNQTFYIHFFGVCVCVEEPFLFIKVYLFSHELLPALLHSGKQDKANEKTEHKRYSAYCIA